MKTYDPYISKQDGRSRIVIVQANGKTTSRSYPRVLMEEYLGVPLSPLDDVHHANTNVKDNDISNLEIINKIDHVSSHTLQITGNEAVNCFQCGKPFTLSRAQQYNRRANVKRDKAGPFCSRKCSGRYGTQVQHS